MPDSRITVFIPSGSGAPGFAGIAACLREDSRIRLISGDVKADAYGKMLSDAFYLMPLPTHESEYIQQLIKICEQEKVQVVLPITTKELEVLARYLHAFSEMGVRVMVSPEKDLAVANDKGVLHRKAQDLGIPVPDGGIVETAAAFKELSLSLFEKTDHLFFKPVRGNGSRGIGRVTRNIQTQESIEKPDLIPLSLNEWLMRLEEVFSTPLLLTEYLPGKEYSVDAFLWNNIEPLIIPRTRDKMVSGISVSGRFENNEKIIFWTKTLLKELNLIGPIGIQWKMDSSGEPRLLEINPRLQGTTSVLRHAGVNVPLLAIYNALEMPVIWPKNILWGNSFTRHWQDVFLDN